MIHFFLLFFLSFSGVGSLGVNYGQVGDNLPSPDKVLELLTSLKISKVRIYDTNPQILTSFANSNTELIVTIENQMLTQLLDPQQALQWVATHIKPYFPAVRITGIAVGNEIFTGNDTVLMANLVPVMIAIHEALGELGLGSYIHVSTPTSLAVLEESFPPSAGSFKGEVSSYISQFLQFLSRTKAPFWVNAYPYFAYKDNPDIISLDYALLNAMTYLVDPSTKLNYDNMLYAQVDAVIFGMARLGFDGIEVRVSETGWPSKGDVDEIGANSENAAIYNRNLLRRQLGNEGTPLRPNTRLEVYLFALFNEDMKPGPTSERNYGLYQPDGTMAYNMGLSTSSASVSLSSSATKTTAMENRSLMYWMFVYLVISFQIIVIRRPF
ncbi:glucan endo-1,3-beta-glucosidase 11-like isoform X1 [Cucurbita pepo subsp. pepo]|uniref:glucan endo-1,3-beta-glucosidase 11-like isoform X1 n=1 Tax=Cucurbita pepo subsp. pepo TaxID=3664 RepID=UPI000C9D6299|nr:glucan endo-1,3-beta-glucosidase 11-like isoform X1 [Cucurbita pepo subsp. pepo]